MGQRLNSFYCKLWSCVVSLASCVIFASSVLVSCAPKDVEAVRLGLIVQQDTIDGPTTLRVVQLAVEAFNQAGGVEIDGERRPVVLLVEDPMGNPEEAARTALRLINQKLVFALVGPVLSVNAIPVSEVANKARVPMVSPASTHVATTANKPFSFRVTYTDSIQGSGMARFARNSLGAATAAVLYDETDDYSCGLAETFRASFESGGGEVSVFAGYVQDDWAGALETMAERSPEVLFLPNFEDSVIPQAQRARALGVTATLLGSDSWPHNELSKIAEFGGAYQAVPWHLSAKVGDQPMQDFLMAYQETWGEPLPDYISPVLAYDATNMILEALRRAGRPDPEAVRNVLADLEDYPGITGNITFRGTGGDPAMQGVILGLRDNQVRFVQRLPASDTDGLVEP